MTSKLRLLVVLLAIAIDPSSVNAQITSNELAGLVPRNIGPATMSGRVVDLAVVNMDPRVFYLASATGGVWKTTDNGVRFAPVFQNRGHAFGWGRGRAPARYQRRVGRHRRASEPAKLLLG